MTNRKVGMDGQILKQLKWIAIVRFENLLAWQLFQVHFCCL